MHEFLTGLFTITGLVFWTLAFAWFVGWFAAKNGINKT
jgi:hypothetical protein